MKSTCLASTVSSPPSPQPSPKGRGGYSGAAASQCVRRLGDMSYAPTTGQRMREGTGDSVSSPPSPQPSPKGRGGHSSAAASRCVRRLGDVSSAPTTGQRMREGTGDSVSRSPSPQPSPSGRGGYSGAAVHETSGLLSNRPPLPKGEGLEVRGKTGHWEPNGFTPPVVGALHGGLLDSANISSRPYWQ